MHWEQLLRLTNGKVSRFLGAFSVVIHKTSNLNLNTFSPLGCAVGCVADRDVRHQLLMSLPTLLRPVEERWRDEGVRVGASF